MAHDPQWLYIGRRTLMARLLALTSSVPVVAMGARSAAAQSVSRPPDDAGSFAFGILGDMPYTRKQEAEYARVLDHMNGGTLPLLPTSATWWAIRGRSNAILSLRASPQRTRTTPTCSTPSCPASIR